MATPQRYSISVPLCFMVKFMLQVSLTPTTCMIYTSLLYSSSYVATPHVNSEVQYSVPLCVMVKFVIYNTLTFVGLADHELLLYTCFTELFSSLLDLHFIEKMYTIPQQLWEHLPSLCVCSERMHTGVW